MREAGFDPEELLEELHKNTHTRNEKCQILSQIEAFFIEEVGELARKLAEIFWRRVLDARLPEERFIAFCHLSIIRDPEEETRLKLKEFKEREENREIVEKAQKLIQGFLSKLN